jgi:hypothetical protein
VLLGQRKGDYQSFSLATDRFDECMYREKTEFEMLIERTTIEFRRAVANGKLIRQEGCGRFDRWIDRGSTVLFSAVQCNTEEATPYSTCDNFIVVLKNILFSM